MKFALAIGLLFSATAFAATGFDCRGMGSPQGGKFCYYVLSQCENRDEVEAGECAIEKYSSNVTWDEVKKITAFQFDPGNDNEIKIHYRVNNKHGVQTQIVTLEVTEKGYNPVAIEIE
jgi:hypothetical protein